MKNAVLAFLLFTLALSTEASKASTELAPLLETSPSRTQVELDRPAEMEYARRFYNDDDDVEGPVPTAAGIWDRLVENAWPDSLTPFTARFQPGKSYLTLYKKFPMWPIDMRSPDRFKRTMSARELMGKSSIGHMSIGWSCLANGETKRSQGFAAQTGEDGGQSTDMLNAGWGVNAMIATFTDGHLQNGYRVQRYFSTEFIDHVEDDKKPVPYFALVIEVPTSDCEHVREFVKSYVMHPSKPWKNFGMLPDPLKLEGAGCGSFAIAALRNAPSLALLMDSYWRTLPIPAKLLGLRTRAFLPNDAIPFSYAKMASQARPISKYNLVLKNWDSGKAALNLRLVDPELTIFSFRKFAQIAARSPGHPKLTDYQVENLEKTKRIYNFPGSNVDDNYPDSSKDAGYQEIDENFDPSFAKVSESVEQWWANRSATSQIHVVSIPFGVGIMIDSNL